MLMELIFEKRTEVDISEKLEAFLSRVRVGQIYDLPGGLSERLRTFLSNRENWHLCELQMMGPTMVMTPEGFKKLVLMFPKDFERVL